MKYTRRDCYATKPRPRKLRGAVVYHGPSRIDGAPIVAILTGIDRSSKNPKTGRMAQLWILPADIDPLAALRTGADAAVCGDCPLRPDPVTGKRVCYVNVGQAPVAVWRAWKRGSYPDLTGWATVAGATWATVEGLPDRLPPVRLGAYGDPAAVPMQVLRALIDRAPRWTGYTHQWRDERNAQYADLCMASADTADDVADAHAAGWRTFGLTAPGATEPVAGTVWCPATPEGGHRATCETCGLCAGNGRPARSISIRAHGAGAGNLLQVTG